MNIFRANLVRWVTESNRSLSIIEDRKFRELMLAGRPQAEIPTRRTIARDIQASFNRCEERINRLLQVYTIFHCLRSTNAIIGVSGAPQFCHRCMDLT